MRILIVALLISVISVCNAEEKVNASISWSGKTCIVPIYKITETEAIQYTSVAAVTKISEKNPLTLEELYGGKCPVNIGKSDSHIYYRLGFPLQRRERVFIFETFGNTIMFVREEPRGCK